MTAEGKNKQVITFGCRLNAYESEIIKKTISDINEDNLVVLNSCAVTSAAESELRSKIKKIRKENSKAKIVVTGCAAQINPEKYAKMPEVDLVLGNAQKNDVKNYEFHKKLNNYSGDKNSDFSENKKSLEVKNRDFDNFHKDKIFIETKAKENIFLNESELSKIRVNDIMSVRDTAPQLVSYFDNQTRAFLEIQNGCNHRCTFCIIPFGRGNSRSVLFGDIVFKVKEMVKMGHKEVVLTGVDISGYGEDLEINLTLSQMIKRLLKLVPELPRLRLSSIDVAEMDDGFFEILENEPRFMPYFHLSVQSGDDVILKRMKRRHSRNQVLEFCKKARKIRPEVTFGADIIAGFPTENNEMFENSLKLISEAKIIFNHIFPYSIREGTPAAKMPQVNGKIVKERAKKLREEGEKELKKYLQKQVGKKLKVLIEKEIEDENLGKIFIGKSENFLDVKILQRNHQDNFEKGKIFEVKILDKDSLYLIA
jgi:threonylcarbamoyladenosine tRNA methylthiotransferase MtaB